MKKPKKPIKPKNGGVTTQGDPPLPPGQCQPGFVWSQELKKCIPDIG